MDYVEKPMDFDSMIQKLDNYEYHCAQDFLDDIDLIAENAIKYNSDLNYETNKIICQRARSLQDFAYALVKAEMDTDFEEECKEIVVRRKKLTAKLKEPQQLMTFDPQTNQIVAGGNVASSTPKTNGMAKRKKSKKRSSWAMGNVSKIKKCKPKVSPTLSGNNEAAPETEEHQQNGQEAESESEEDAEVTLNESKEFRVNTFFQKQLSPIAINIKQASNSSLFAGRLYETQTTRR
jgi:hypothetical protein